MTHPPRILDIVAATSPELDGDRQNFSILNQALAATGLDQAVGAAEDVKVFAPTDRAFIKLARDLGFEGRGEADALDYLLRAVDVIGEQIGADGATVLSNILLYHVSPGAKSTYEIRESDSIDTLLGASFEPKGNRLVDLDPDIGNPKLVGHTIEAGNGTIQPINRVLLPVDVDQEAVAKALNEPDAPVEPETPTIAGLVVELSSDDGAPAPDANGGDFDLLFAALGAADPGLLAAVSDPQADLTVFAPTDAAFVALAQDLGFDGDDEAAALTFIVDTLNTLTGDASAALTEIISYHVSAGTQTLADISAAGSVTALNGETFTPAAVEGGVDFVDNGPGFTDPTLALADVPASNGVVHVIDRVLIPETVQKLADMAADPAPEPEGFKVEAETFDLKRYEVEHVDAASGDAAIKLTGHRGKAEYVFEGESGLYDMTLQFFDENDGQGRFRVKINDERVETIRLNKDLDGNLPTEETLTEETIEDLLLETGDTINFIGVRDGHEFARLDSVEFEPIATDDGYYA